MIRAAMRPRATSPPTTPPTIAGVLLVVREVLLRAGAAENVDLEVVLGEGCGRRVDSTPFML